jgi:hypothetical protein
VDINCGNKSDMFAKQLPRLIFNHADAWGITLIISLVALVVHPPFQPRYLSVPLVLAFCYWLGFAVNDYFDAPFDGQDAKKGRGNFFVQVPVTRLQAALFDYCFGGDVGRVFHAVRGERCGGCSLWYVRYMGVFVTALALEEPPGF